MQQQANASAVLLFIRTEFDEVRSKKWYSGAGYQKSLQLARFLNRQALSVAKASQLPTFVISGKDQVGEDFGARFTHAIQSIFDQGFQKVIALGNDCLSLTVDHLNQANKQLQSCSLVVGPAKDGGAYLIGIRREIFHAPAFKQLPWQQDSFLRGLKEMVQQQEAVVALLSEENDADSADELRAAVKRIGFQRLSSQLFQLLGYIRQAWPKYNHPGLLYTSFTPSLFQRGPPSP